ncbi:hypothetical protein, conserved [Eimeria brunetti]|uniref:Uncharacterized protein n=1 Tax=Eimeria brunetti TaxID=51314 RepID=U6LG54_9EIME|nr:hypothetical protein, conserved [Eimeria brunetti]
MTASPPGAPGPLLHNRTTMPHQSIIASRRPQSIALHSQLAVGRAAAAAAAATAAAAAAAAAAAIKSVLASGSCSSAAEPNIGVPPLSAEGAHLILAAAVASTDIIEELICHGAAAAEFAELDGWTAFHHISCLRGKQRMARFLLQAGADASVMTGAFDAASPLLRAAATGAVCGMVRIEASLPPQQNQSEAKSELLLQLQQHLQQQQKTDSLIPRYGKDTGLLPIHLSCFGAHRALTRLLLHAGTRIDALTEQLRWSPLHFAAASGSAALDLEVVKVLLAFGANPLKAVRFIGLRAACLGEGEADNDDQGEQITPLHIGVLGVS